MKSRMRFVNSGVNHEIIYIFFKSTGKRVLILGYNVIFIKKFVVLGDLLIKCLNLNTQYQVHYTKQYPSKILLEFTLYIIYIHRVSVKSFYRYILLNSLNQLTRVKLVVNV